MSWRSLAALMSTAVLSYGAVLAQGDDEADASQFNSSVASSEAMPRAGESMLLDVATTGSGLVAVGERGHILRSTEGESWEQVADVPTRSTLTAVFSLGDRVWAAGHDQVIVHSADGGQSWQRQYSSPDVFDPEANSPLLDIFFLDEQRGFAVGAYAVFLRTSDGGQSWEVASLELADDAADEEASDEQGAAANDPYAYDDEFDIGVDYHLNGMTKLADGTLYIAAEQGNGYRSRNEGETWQELVLPYGGSMFGALTLGQDRLLTFGLRGNAFVSVDAGSSWQQLDTDSLNSLNGAVQLSSGEVVMVGVNGEVLVLADDQIRSLELAEGNDIAAVVIVDSGLVMVGEGGSWRYPLEQVLR
ncbi:MAG: YCF48-related protein [Pseudomonadota bacterium]